MHQKLEILPTSLFLVILLLRFIICHKKSWPYFYSELVNELGQEFLEAYSIINFWVYISCNPGLWIQRFKKSQSGSGSPPPSPSAPPPNAEFQMRSLTPNVEHLWFITTEGTANMLFCIPIFSVSELKSVYSQGNKIGIPTAGFLFAG